MLATLKLSLRLTNQVNHLELEGLFTQRSRPSRTSGESVGGILETDNYDVSEGLRYHVFDTRPDTEFDPTLNTCVEFRGGQVNLSTMLPPNSEWRVSQPTRVTPNPKP